MITKESFRILLSTFPGVILLVELYLQLPFRNNIKRILDNAQSAIVVMKSKRISDSWKQKAIPQYSCRIMMSNIVLTIFFALSLVVFLGVYYLVGMIFIGNGNEVLETFKKPVTYIFATSLGVLYALFRNRISKNRIQKTNDYNIFSRILHYFTLDNNIVKEIAFDLDCVIAKMQTKTPKIIKTVYVSGLARSGTTILLEALYSTKCFTTLTYRDMPLVISPFIWRIMTKNLEVIESKKKQRAHGDGIYVNYESPEAFEEVFWITFSKKEYIKKNFVIKQKVKSALAEKYFKYVKNIIASSKSKDKIRYLSKNNNNLIRINGIKSIFTNSIIIVPFRNPTDHAKSLLNQHKRFLEIHSRDKFSLKYMNWLGHFEFGQNFKPFRFSNKGLPTRKRDTLTIEYWLHYWAYVYNYLIEKHSSDVLFFDYDRLCDEPEMVLSILESKLQLYKGSLKKFSSNIRRSKINRKFRTGITIENDIKYVYSELQNLAIK